MEPNEIHQSIAQQIDHMKPDALKPGTDVGMEVVDENTLRVLIHEIVAEELDDGVTKISDRYRKIDVRYDAGPDTYTVIEHHPGEAPSESSDVYCDQLGAFVFGEKAKPWTQPFGGISVQNPDGSWTQVSEF